MLLPDFDKNKGLVPVIVQCAESKKVLMLAYMNEKAFELTIETKIAHYYSRSRQKMWRKGETSGHEQIVKSIRLDCDRDTILLLVEQIGKAACHTGYSSCFYQEYGADEVFAICEEKIFDPAEVYKK